MKLTREILEKNHACKPQADIFNSEFPDGMEFTRPNLERCVELGLDIWWAECLIPVDKLAAYQTVVWPAWSAYLAVQGPAREAYLAAIIDALVAALGD